jgi:hypothetical protein
VAASCENDILYDSVRITGANYSTAVTSSLRSVSALDVTSDVEVTYVVSQLVHGYDDAGTAFDDVTATLTENVEDDLFTSYLRAFAAVNGATSLDDASSESLVLVDTPSPTFAPTSHHHKNHKLSDGDIAAIVIMTIFGFVCIVVAAVYLTRSTSAPRERGYDAPHALQLVSP